jgi:RNA polymerase sigma-70 factor, ECF subfamily
MQHSGIHETSDQVLVGRAGEGDASAYGCLYDRYIDQIYRYVYFRVRNQAEAEDLTELTFLKTFELVQKDGDKIVYFKAWIYRTAHNLVIDHYRTRKNPADLDEAVNVHDPDPLPETAVIKGEEDVLLHRMVGKLEGIYQQVITCRFINGFSYEETAQIMGIKSSNVGVIQYRALKKLRSLLRKEGGHDAERA